jgi:hypothetical protein
MGDSPLLARQPLVLVASVSRSDRHALEKLFGDARFEVRSIEAAGDADGAVSGHGGPCALVIDAGLLGMTHDGQWRSLRQRHPDLGVVIRCLIGSDRGLQRMDPRTFLVHPDYDEGLVEAARALGAVAAVRPGGTRIRSGDGEDPSGNGGLELSARNATKPRSPRARAGRRGEAPRRVDRIPSRQHGP